MNQERESTTIHFLGRWADCPIGKDLQPGSGLCQKCQYFVEKEWYTNGGIGAHITTCKAPSKAKEDANDIQS